MICVPAGVGRSIKDVVGKINKGRVMSKKDKEDFYADLSDSIMELYDVDKTTAYNAIKLSDMDAIIRKVGDFIYHDVIEYWAESVWQCYLRETA